MLLIHVTDGTKVIIYLLDYTLLDTKILIQRLTVFSIMLNYCLYRGEVMGKTNSHINN